MALSSQARSPLAVVWRDRWQGVLVRALGKLLAALLHVTCVAAQGRDQPSEEPRTDDLGDGRSVAAISQRG
jgi:hypothetical protein